MPRSRAGKAEKNLGTDRLISQVGENMARDRIAEAYIGIKPILDAGLPMLAAMSGIQCPGTVPAGTAPVGHRHAGNGGKPSSRSSPAPVIKTGPALAQKCQEAQNQFGGEMDPDAPVDDKRGHGGGRGDWTAAVLTLYWGPS